MVHLSAVLLLLEIGVASYLLLLSFSFPSRYRSSFAAAAPAATSHTFGKSNRPNVILIVVDDLRADLPAYGNANVISPNIDRLARKSIVFDRAYNQVRTNRFRNGIKNRGKVKRAFVSIMRHIYIYILLLIFHNMI
jgi:hypothetical protein